jgi:hypothetical protein
MFPDYTESLEVCYQRKEYFLIFEILERKDKSKEG